MGLGQSDISHTEGLIDPSDCQVVELRPHRVLKISSQVTGAELERIRRFLLAYEDLFAWRNEDMKGIPACYGEHHIDLMDNAVPVRERQ